jgi:ABC-type lipoprotein export system ATPase subunit
MTNREFKFKVISRGSSTESKNEQLFLMTDNWNDWGEFFTLFRLIYVNQNVKKEIGYLKIGQFTMSTKLSRPEIPDSFESLDERFFSLGQDTSYYERLNELGEDLRDYVLKALKDVAFDLDLFKSAFNEPVTKRSLLRYVTPTTVEGQFHRMAKGSATLTPFSFYFNLPVTNKNKTSEKLTFDVKINQAIPTNVHVLIGRNGVGKTHLLNLMSLAIINQKSSKAKSGTFIRKETTTEDPFDVIYPSEKEELFANLVSVTFSAFDPFKPIAEKRDKTDGVKYSYIGLKRTTNRGNIIGTPKSPEMLANEFVKSLIICLNSNKLTRWLNALKTLESDPVFNDLNIKSLAVLFNEIDTDIETEVDKFKKTALSQFRKLSSGHKIVILTITRLVETVEERSLVLIDEPEAHLHPPLLSAFIRSLSSLLLDRNGVAIIATHSPVILQEVPKSCVWKLHRNGNSYIVNRPEIETFGENINVLTKEVFELELVKAGYINIIDKIARDGKSYEEVKGMFDNKLGSDARLALKIKLSERIIKEN